METKSRFAVIKRLGDVSNSGVIIYNLDSKSFDFFNENFLSMFGISSETMVNDPSVLLSRVVPEDIEHLQSKYKDLLRTGHATNTEFSIRVGSEGVKHFICDFMVLEQEPVIVGIVKDITKQKAHENYAIHYSAQKDTLLDMLTHNLGGPLHLSKDILAEISRTDQNKMDATEVQKALKYLEQNTQLCLDIVNDFLKKEHDESIRTYVRRTRFDVLEKIQVTIERIKAMNRNKEFIISTAVPNLQVNADAIKFFQAIHNLLSNAIKFTGDNGKIEIKVADEGKDFVVCIKDNGIGIPDELKASIFCERIGGRVGLKGEKSSGLGLLIAKKIVNVMGGDITFESQESQGTSFFVRLPKE